MVTFQQLVATGGPLLMLVVIAFDLYCLVRNSPTPGQVIQWWAHDHPILAGAFSGFVGAFAAHIFWHT